MYNRPVNTSRRRFGKLNTISIILFAIASLFYFANEKYTFPEKSKEEDFFAVKEVHDGDTVTVRIRGGREKVRLIGIDAPEIGQEPWGEKSREYLRSLLAASGSMVRIETDIEERDKYGRLLAYLWTADGRLVNLLMVKSGYAMLYTFPPNLKHSDEFRLAQREARKAGAGIWSERGLKEKPADYRLVHPRK